MGRLMNFNAGPGTLPVPALEQAQAELLEFAGTGMSVMEHSHRGKDYGVVHAEAQALLKELLGLGSEWRVLFLQGGASMQFAQIPMSFLGANRSADYVLTGVWGEKAIAEGKNVAALLGGGVRVAATTAEPLGPGKTTFRRLPRSDEYRFDEKAAYVHFTSNETIHGVQFDVGDSAAGVAGVPFPAPPTGVPLVCDMSSDILWKPMDFSRLSFVYAGAQKNMGPSGLAVILVKESFLAEGRRDVPKIFRYDVAAENDSLYNTPPTFAIYFVRHVLAWCKAEGGLPAMEAKNRAKAKLVYDAVDASGGFYAAPVEKNARSVMNVVFRLPTPELEERLVAEAKAHGMVGIKGHRSVGGIRVSLYNAVPLAWAEALAGFLREFAKKNG